MRDLRGKRVLVTGGARGIGYAIGRRLGQEGAEVVLTDLDEESVHAAAVSLMADGITAHAFALDVTDGEQVLGVRDQVLAELGPVDVLVNNAGVVFGGPFLAESMERHELTYRVNTLGVVAVTHAFLPSMLALPEANVVIISSASALVGVPYGSTYASSKWAALGFGESLRAELHEEGHRNVSVTTVCPSFVSSGLFAGSEPPALTAWLTPEDIADSVLKAVRGAQPVVYTPWLVRVGPVIRGLFPTRVADVVSRALGVTRSMAGWTGHGPAGAPKVVADVGPTDRPERAAAGRG